MKTNARQPAVAGMFYPDIPDILHNTVQQLLKETIQSSPQHAPKALIVPHAGYIYSGSIAANAYALLSPEKITRVILLGPAHRVSFRGLAVPDNKSFWSTPLGDIAICENDTKRLSDFQHVSRSDEAHEAEHSLEVQLPFLQEVLGAFYLVPVLVGESNATEISEGLEALWGGEETLVVISSDLSHYLPYEKAVEKDTITSRAILNLDLSEIDRESACGLLPISGLIEIAKRKNLYPQQIDLRNSGNTAGSRDQVVGYGSFAFYEKKTV